MIQRCPPTEVLEAFAAGACADDAVGSHIEECAECRAAFEECRESDRFLAGVRMALTAHEARGASEAPESMSPDMVSGYQIQEELHRGGQGVVYRAVQTRTRRTVAIKVLLGGRRATGRQKERFEREIRIAAGLRHPNIVAVHDSGYISDGRYGLVMEYIEGVPLDRWSRGLDGASGREARRGALRTRLGVMAKVCDAVLCAHQHSIVHRDLKPANILVDAAGEPHILDFGIARDTGQHTRLTHAGEFAGTLAYASPEQVSGDLSRVDTRTDIYSLGVILYELVSGRMPYAVDGPMSEILRNIETAEPAPLQRATRGEDGPWVDGEVATIASKAMAKDPARRYQTAAGLGNDINRYLAGDAIEARRDSTWYVVRKTALRHRVFVGAAGLIFVLLAAFGVAMAWQAHRLEVRSRELADALSASNIERCRALAAAGKTPLAEDSLVPELRRAAVTQIDGPQAGFAGSSAALNAYWALWDIFQKSSRLATLGAAGFAGDKKVELLYFDEDGQRLSALDNSGKLVSWSVATWEPMREIKLVAPIDGVEFRAALAPGGSIAVFGGGALRVIDPRTGAIDAQADDLDAQAVMGAFSPDGTLLATIGRDNRLRIRDARSLGTLVTMAEDAVGIFNSGASCCNPTFSLDGALVAAARPKGALGLWNTASGVLERTLQPPDSLAIYVRSKKQCVSRIAFGPDGTIAGALGAHLLVWPAAATAPLDLGATGGPIFAVAFVPGSEGRLLVSSGSTPGGGGGITIIWDLTTGGRVATFRQGAPAHACACSPDGRLIGTTGNWGYKGVQVYEAAPEPHIRLLQPGHGQGTLTALSRDGRTLMMTAAPDGETGWDVVMMDLKSGTTIRRFHREGSPIRTLEFAPDGKSWFEGEVSGRITQWDLPAGTTYREFAAPGAPADRAQLNGVRLSPDGSVLARARNDGPIDLWDVPSGRWIDRLDSGTTAYAAIDFSPDGRTIVARHREKCVLWDVQTRQPKRTATAPNSYPVVCYSPDGTVIAHGAAACRIQFFDAHTGRVLSQSNLAWSAGGEMVFHPGGTVFFATAGFDASIRLWDTRTARELLSLEKHTGFIRSLLLTPDGNTLISSDDSGLVLAWDLAYYNDRIRRELATQVSKAAVP